MPLARELEQLKWAIQHHAELSNAEKAIIVNYMNQNKPSIKKNWIGVEGHIFESINYSILYNEYKAFRYRYMTKEGIIIPESFEWNLQI